MALCIQIHHHPRAWWHVWRCWTNFLSNGFECNRILLFVTKKFKKTLSTFSSVQTIEEPSRITEQTQSLIDLIIVSSELVNIVNTEVLDMHVFSDHCLVKCGLDLQVKSNAAGSDVIGLQMLKLCSSYILHQLTRLFNSCLLKGFFSLSRAMEGGSYSTTAKDQQSEVTFGPIRILLIQSKLLEKLVAAQVSRYVAECRILPDVQSGFVVDKAHRQLW